MQKLNLNFRTIFSAALAITSLYMLANTIQLYAERRVDPLGFLFAAGASGLSALVLAIRSLSGSDDQVTSILTAPDEQRKTERHPDGPGFFDRWFGGFGGFGKTA